MRKTTYKACFLERKEEEGGGKGRTTRKFCSLRRPHSPVPTPFSNSNKFPSFFPPSSLGATDIENFCPLPSPFRKKCLLVSCSGGRGKGALREGGGGLSLGGRTDRKRGWVGDLGSRVDLMPDAISLETHSRALTPPPRSQTLRRCGGHLCAQYNTFVEGTPEEKNLLFPEWFIA